MNVLDMQEEIWKDIPGYEALYQVSNTGRIKRIESLVVYSNGIIAKHKERLLKPEITKGGYIRTTLSKDNIQKSFMVHRLVALVFINNIEKKPHVNHIDGDKGNNTVSNLEWCTPSENEIHSYKYLGKINAGRKLSMNDAKEIRRCAKKGKDGNIKELCNKYNISRRALNHIINNTHYVETS